ncbi:hypothetical protein TanjilG_09676 [Lupinus angustifolius]|uniref:UvrD-like helicase ATP-binding domain-containing protein n=1 Tax=Lupinus angustifolius TaxID=3871 RepID=A0A4P1R3Z8_LUPAN|nr:hypothetical protein TanjilG_09676 [Lupinus angustifolius]
MMNSSSSNTKKATYNDHGFLDIIFSWSLQDIFNEDLYKYKVKNIELSFNSVDHYFGSYVYPLLEETRAQLCSSMEILSSAPFAEVVSLCTVKSDEKNFYEVSTDSWKNRSSGNGKELYKILSGDVFILADFKPETAADLLRVGKMWCLASLVGIAEEQIVEDRDIISTFKVIASEYIDPAELRKKSVFLVFLTNIIPSRRIWKALHMSEDGGKSKLIEKILCAGDLVKETCDYCPEQIDALSDVRTLEGLSSELNQSQYNAICACLSSVHCDHKPTVDLIWGPPGTGKTKTLGTLLFALLKMNGRTLVCAPTNVAIKEVASRVVSMVKESFRKSDDLFCALGDMLLFGNNERLKVGADIVDIYLDDRVKQLTLCFAPQSGWLSCVFSMIDLLENCVSDYHIFVENKLIKEQEHIDDDDNTNMTKDEDSSDCSEGMCSSFLDFVRERFLSKASSLKDCVSILCTHVPRSYILEDNFENLVCLFHLLDSFQALLFQSNIVSEVLEELFSPPEEQHSSSESFMGAEYLLYKSRSECLSLLRSLKDSLGELNLPHFLNQESIREFCLQKSSLIFCTASSSFKLHSVVMVPLSILVIDEAAQLKESESTIPLLLPMINHAILVGDERQLPAMVLSNVSYEAGFGRSLFGRLSSLDHPNHLLDIQYRMHPAIKIVGGREESDEDGRSRKNMVEVAVVMQILKKCFKAWLDSKDSVSIGIVSPYAAQVVAMKDQIGRKYDSHNGFNVNVRTIDGFQGGELDIIILSTVRTSGISSLGFISSPQRTNVALTRARHCLWILGNSKILTSQDNVWKYLVLDAIKRDCFFNADDDKDLAKAIWDAKKELDQFDDLLKGDSLLFRNSRWKFTFHSYALVQVLFSDYFLKSFKNLKSERTKKSVINLLLKLSLGWRPKRIKVDLLYGNSSLMLKQFKVEGIFVLCSKDIVKESNYTQVLKIWDVLPPEDIPKLVKRLDSIFGSYTDDFISRCNEKYFEGNIEVPIMWEKSVEIMKLKNLGHNGDAAESSVCSDQRIYVENSKVEESLLLMKFYSLSPVVVSHLLSDRIGNEIDLPFEVTDEEREIILFPRSTFVLGRSGTGKTTVLTMKLFQKENLHHMAVEETYGMDSAAVPCLNLDKEYNGNSTMNERPVLRQLFVTVSPKLCQAVKHHVVRLKRSLIGANVSTESSSIEEDNIDSDASVLLRNIPDSFVDLPTTSFPLVITFQKFLMMLDGTLGNSFFERFSDISSHSQNLGVRSIVLETFIRNKEVTYDRFDSLYWPHFNSQYTKKLDTSRVFTEIISHIKGSIQSTEPGDGKLSRQGYLSLSENRASSLSKQQRMMIYDIYQSYEKMKMDKGEFDLADIVIDLHRRLSVKSFKGDEMSFVYIDEVQDLTMSQIALFKYVCQNIDEGFVFCGDTAQTIARGIDFRFQDIKSVFYKKFVLESKKSSYNHGKEKAKVSEIFLLKNNFRTHAGVLRLSQSTIDLLYRFFPYSIDVLEPETSSISGEAPVVLECGNKENAIVTIFGNNGNVGGKIVGFGAEQVILVRDDSARKEILDYVGKNALVLTILECKGLEFQDVLLYNFFGSSPLKNRWRVIYEFMKEQDMLDSTELKSYQSFNDSKHNILCSELKQLYVAITRTRQRLWISENTDEFSRPMFEYWNKKCLVQFKELDDSLAQAMKVASSPEEWKSRGIKLYHQSNYGMATMCFERAGDTYWERRSMAAGLRAHANHLRDVNPEDANATLREAAEIFEGIGLADIAAQCFSDLGDHERAGKLFLEKCEKPDLKRAGDCFNLAGCYEVAAQVYARGNFFSDCLTVCANGGLYEIGLDYIQHWKQNETSGHRTVGIHDLFTIEQNFLESCARNYFDHKDIKSMMKFVRAFHTIELKRDFLRSISLFEELLLLEEELGNFMEAADIAKMMGNIIREADLLGKADKLMEAYELIVFYVVGNSLWSVGSKGWPLKPFSQNAEFLKRALSYAKKVSGNFYELACTEVDILSNEHSNIFKIMIDLKFSRLHGKIGGECLCLWKLLDAHFQMNSSKYVWEDNLLNDSVEGMILKNQLSVETLFYCWSSWKDHIVHILQDLPSLKSGDIQQHSSYVKFVLNYLGVQKQFSNLNENYNLLIPDANWVIKMGDRSLRKNGKLFSVDVHFLVSAAHSYWCSELLSVGMAVLHNLEALYKFSVNKFVSEFCQFRTLILIYEVSKFLLESKWFTHSHSNLKTLEKFLRHPIDSFCRYVLPLDKSKSLTKDMVTLRATKTCQNLLEEVIYENINGKNTLTFGQIGKVAVLVLGMANRKNELYVEIMKRFENGSPWDGFFYSLHRNPAQAISQADEAVIDLCTLSQFHQALQLTYNVNWRLAFDYISPSCFMDLIERILLLTSCWKGFIFATKSSFIEWFIYQDGNSLPVPNLSLKADVQRVVEDVHKFIADVLRELLYNQTDTQSWIAKSNMGMKDYFPLFVLRLVVSICLLNLISGKSIPFLHDLLAKRHITKLLPMNFFKVLSNGKKNLGLKVFAMAFKVIGNPLVIVRLSDKLSEIVCPDAISVDLEICQQRELMLQALFPTRVHNMDGESASVIVDASGSETTKFPSTNCSDFQSESSAHVSFWDMLEKLLVVVEKPCLSRILHYCKILKDFVDDCVELLISSICGSLPQNPVNLEDKNEMGEMIHLVDEIKQLSLALSVSDSVTDKQAKVIDEFCKKILSRREKVEHVLNQLFLLYKKNIIVDNEALLDSISTTDSGENVPNDLEQSEEDMSKNSQSLEEETQDNMCKNSQDRKKNSQGTKNSGHGKIMENAQGKKNKPKKNRGNKKNRGKK